MGCHLSSLLAVNSRLFYGTVVGMFPLFFSSLVVRKHGDTMCWVVLEQVLRGMWITGTNCE